jgi:hypothetical protein
VAYLSSPLFILMERKMSKDTGGCAFPNDGSWANGYPEGGMTIRDYFAGKILTGLIANATYGGEVQRVLDQNKEVWNAGKDGDDPREYIADLAYAFADAMIAARK